MNNHVLKKCISRAANIYEKLLTFSLIKKKKKKKKKRNVIIKKWNVSHLSFLHKDISLQSIQKCWIPKNIFIRHGGWEENRSLWLFERFAEPSLFSNIVDVNMSGEMFNYMTEFIFLVNYGFQTIICWIWILNN